VDDVELTQRAREQPPAPQLAASSSDVSKQLVERNGDAVEAERALRLCKPLWMPADRERAV
jgi:hypothetical protein